MMNKNLIDSRSQKIDEKLGIENLRDFLYQKYWGERLSVPKIAKLLGCSHAVLYQVFKKYKITIRTLSEANRNPSEETRRNYSISAIKRSGTFYKNFRNKEWLYKKYFIEELNLHEIAIIENVNWHSIQRQILKFGFKPRSAVEATKKRIKKENKKKIYCNKEWLEDRYWNKKLKLSEIAKEARVDTRTILYWIKRNNIKLRGLLKCNKHGVLPLGESAFNRLFRNYKRQAKSRNLIFLLDKQYFKKIIKKNCFYCGIQPKRIITDRKCNGGLIYNGIDRLDSQIGYVSSNCIPCCITCNRMKWNQDYSEFINHIKKIHNHIGGSARKILNKNFNEDSPSPISNQGT